MSRIALSLAAWVLLGGRGSIRAGRRRSHTTSARLSAGSANASASSPASSRSRSGATAQGDEGAPHVALRVRRRSDHARRVELVTGTMCWRRTFARGPTEGPRALTPDELRGHVLGLFLATNGETTGAALVGSRARRARSGRKVEQAARRSGPLHRRVPRRVAAPENPAVWGIPRTPSKPGVTVTSAGITSRVRRGQVATVYLRGMNRDADTWSDPLRFDPSRHETQSKELQRSLLPFRVGAAAAASANTAMAELAAVLRARATRQRHRRRPDRRRRQVRAPHPRRPA